MTYANLYANADFYLNCNNTITPQILPTGTFQAKGTGIAKQFIADAPPNTGTTHSMLLNNYASTADAYWLYGIPAIGTRYRVFDGADWATQGETVAFWYKYSVPEGATTAGGTTNIFTVDRGSDEYIEITHGTFNEDTSSTVQKINWINSAYVGDGQTVTYGPTYSTLHKLSPNVWHHIAIVYGYTQTGASGGGTLPDGYLERALYVDGIMQSIGIVGYTVNGPADAGIGTSTGKTSLFNNLYSTEGASVSTKSLAHFAIWKYPMTKEEIQNLAWYGKTTSDYDAVVLSKNPVYFTTFDNPDKDTAASVYGTYGSSWGAFNDNFEACTVNETGFINKSWKFGHSNTYADGGVYGITNSATMRQGIHDVEKTGEFTFEFWFKAEMGAKPVFPRTFMFFGETGTIANGGFKAGLQSDGAVLMQIPERTGASTWTVASAGIPYRTVYAPSDTGTYKGIQHTIGNRANKIADGEWHHMVIRFTRTKGGTNKAQYRVYIDGTIASVNRTYDYGWIDNNDPVSRILLGNDTQQLSSTNLPVWIDKFAMYPTAISDDQIFENYILGKNYFATNAGSMYYWNGQAWTVPGNRYFWDGTQWAVLDAQVFDGTNWIDVV